MLAALLVGLCPKRLCVPPLAAAPSASFCPAGITGAGAAGWDLPCLTSLALQNSPGVDDAGVAALAGLTALRRWGWHGKWGHCIPPALLFLRLRADAWDRHCNSAQTSGSLPAAPRSLNLKQCKRVGDAGLAALAPRLQRLTSLCLQVRRGSLLSAASEGLPPAAAVPPDCSLPLDSLPCPAPAPPASTACRA